MSTIATPPLPAIPDLPVRYEINPTIAYEDQLFTRERGAAWIGIHRDTLGCWERQQRGPKVTRVGRTKIRYRLGDVLQWFIEPARRTAGDAKKEQHTLAGTSPARARAKGESEIKVLIRKIPTRQASP